MKAFSKVLFVLLSFVFLEGYSQKVSFRLENQVSAWAGIRASDTLLLQAGSRYIPVISIADSMKKERIFDAEASFKLYGNMDFTGTAYTGGEALVRPYRMWLRYATRRLEIRAGLQKINFGSATILRPLMWFDQMDPRDPLQITDGVYGLLGRYYFRGNTNIWLWGLVGNHKLRGWETVPGIKKTPEYGGRLQIPLAKGEAALSFHRRKSDFTTLLPPVPAPSQTSFYEDKYAFDGKWDIGPGIWFEGAGKHNDPANGIFPEWEFWLNAGLDYTFPIGNGLTLTTEYLRYQRKATALLKAGEMNYSVLTGTYPFGLLNSAMALIYYDWNNKNWYRFISLKREYDYWSFYLMGFWNPENASLPNSGSEKNFFIGKGIQLMAVVNF